MNDEIEDQICILKTVQAFRSYRTNCLGKTEKKLDVFTQLPLEQKQLLDVDVNALAVRIKHCVEQNASFLEHIAHTAEELFSLYWPNVDRRSLELQTSNPSFLDVEKVYSTLRQFQRDWSAEGASERRQCYKILLEKIETLFQNVPERKSVRVLVPGAGLSRLSFEISLLGFFCQANEFSYHMLISGNHILNHTASSHQYTIYPYIDTTTNLNSREDQFFSCLIPDKSAQEMISEKAGEFSMVAGEFLEVYGKEGQQAQWNCVVTCFFIDTAHNALDYLTVIHRMLVNGGYWINIGPLLYHFSDTEEESLDLSYDELLNATEKIGFSILEQDQIETSYTANCKSLKRTSYNSKFWLAQKKG